MATADPATTAPSTATRSRSTATDLALIAAFAAVLAAVTIIGSIPTGSGVPVTLQTFGVLLAGCLLGPIRGFLSVSLYLLLGAIGLPVFANHSAGLASFSDVATGYLISFPFAAALAGFVVVAVGRQRRTRAVYVFLAAMAGTVLCHVAGFVWMKYYLDVTLWQAVKFDAPFWLGDIVKAAIVGIVAAEVHRAFPRLIDRG